MMDRKVGLLKPPGNWVLNMKPWQFLDVVMKTLVVKY
jgi:hypothetical protein